MGVTDLIFEILKMSSGVKKMSDEIKSVSTDISNLKAGDIVTPDTFLRFYDIRAYNPHSKQNDIKIAKDCDFEGVIIIHNHYNEKYYIGAAKKVLRKLFRIFAGHEQMQIYEDWNDGDYITIKAIALHDTEYDNIDKLRNDLYQKYARNSKMYN